MDKIIVKGARVNNLKNIDIEIPKNKLVVMTGVSGSGKSSLAFDTIYAEGQRRYIESLSAYARQFLGGSEKPDVDSIEGLSPSISIDQKSTNKNPRSTVGTITEIYDYLRLLYARVGVPYCPHHHIPITSQSIEEMTNRVLEIEDGTKIMVMAPIVKGEKGTHKDTLEQLRKDGYIRCKIDGEIKELTEDIQLDKNKKHIILVIVDRLIIKPDIRTRLYDSIETASKLAHGKIIIDLPNTNEEILMSEDFACPYCDFSLLELEPRIFSFNAPYGACPDCKGLGVKYNLDIDLVIPDRNLSINEGAIKPFSIDDDNINRTQLEAVAKYYDIDLNAKVKDLDKKKLDIILYGSPDILEFKYTSKNGNTRNAKDYFEGVITNLERRYIETKSTWIREWIELYMRESVCPTCKGARLGENALSVLINNKNIYDVSCLSIRDLKKFINELKLSPEKKEIASLLIKEIDNRLEFLINVGLEYLTLSRTSGTLSGGESQRIRLATQIGSKLTGVLYVLDEPTTGLHFEDIRVLLGVLNKLVDKGNTIIVIEHNLDVIKSADYLIDMGPEGGRRGGNVLFTGTPEALAKSGVGFTAPFLKEELDIANKKK